MRDFRHYRLLRMLITAGLGLVRDEKPPILYSLLSPDKLMIWAALAAKLLGRRFSCKSLRGDAQFYPFINSDMTMTCSCYDADGVGILGNLQHQALSEILSGPTAQRFRRALAQGHLPISLCSRCDGLLLVSKEQAEADLHSYSLPTGIGVENNVLCNLQCICCPRFVVKIRSSTRLSLRDMEIVSETLTKHGVKQVTFFNFGEPFLDATVYKQLEILRRGSPALWIICSTNGLLLSTDEKREAALLMDHICFAMHGSTQDSLAQYQRRGNFGKSYENMKALVRYRNCRGLTHPLIEWKYVLFNWNDTEALITKALELATEAGADFLSFWPTAAPGHGLSIRYFLGRHFRLLARDFNVPNWWQGNFTIDLRNRDRKH